MTKIETKEQRIKRLKSIRGSLNHIFERLTVESIVKGIRENRDSR